MRRFTFAACVVAGLLATATAQAQQPEWAMPDILAAAKAEGQVTVYSSTNEQEGLPLWKLFEDATGIKVNYVRAADAALMGKIAIEARSSLTEKSGRFEVGRAAGDGPAASVEVARANSAQCLEVLRAGVALVDLPAVVRMGSGELDHHRVASGLGEHAGGRH